MLSRVIWRIFEQLHFPLRTEEIPTMPVVSGGIFRHVKLSGTNKCGEQVAKFVPIEPSARKTEWFDALCTMRLRVGTSLLSARAFR